MYPISVLSPTNVEWHQFVKLPTTATLYGRRQVFYTERLQKRASRLLIFINEKKGA